jgi:hypothetical protein
LGQRPLRVVVVEPTAAAITSRTASALERPMCWPSRAAPASAAAAGGSTALCRSAGFEPDVRFESTDLRFHLRLVETGHATALVPDLARRADDDVRPRQLGS